MKCRMPGLTPRERGPLPNPRWAPLLDLILPLHGPTSKQSCMPMKEARGGRSRLSLTPIGRRLRAPVIIAGHPLANLLFLGTPDKEHGNSPYQGQNGHQEKDLGVSTEKIVSQAEGEGPQGR